MQTPGQVETSGARPVAYDKAVAAALNLANAIYKQTGDANPHVLSRPSNAHYLVLLVQSGTFDVKPGDYIARTFASATDVDTGTDRITITAHGFTSGAGPYKLTTSSALPAPLTTDTLVYVRVIDADTITLHTTHAGAVHPADGTVALINITTTGTGTQTIATMPSATVLAQDGYASLRLRDANPVQSAIILIAPAKITVRGSASGDVLQFWWF